MTRNRPFGAGEHTRERRRGFDSGIRREKRRPPAAHRDQAKARKRVSCDVAERDLGRKETGLTRIRRGRGLGGRAERPGEASAARPRGAEEEERREGGGELGKAVSLVATVAVAPGGFVSRCCGRACRNAYLSWGLVVSADLGSEDPSSSGPSLLDRFSFPETYPTWASNFCLRNLKKKYLGEQLTSKCISP